MENDWPLNNNDGQGNSLNPGNETDHLNWLNNLEEYDMDALMGAADHVNTDQDADEDDEELHLQAGQSSKPGKRFTAAQIHGLESLYQRCAHPDDSMRKELGVRIGLDARQVKFWFQNRRTKIKVKAIGDENKDIQHENAQLQAENMELQQKLLCGTCRDPNEKWNLLNENAKLKDTKRRAQEYLIKLIHVARIPHSEILEHVESASLNMVPFTDDCSTNQDTLLSYTERALYEFVMLAGKGEPMWLPTTDGKILNDQEYRCHTSPELLGPCPQGFVMEGTKGTTLVRGTAFDLVGLLTDVSRWSKMFPGIIAGVRASNNVSSGNFATLDGLIQEMNVDLWVQSPRAPNRSVKFLRFSKQIENSQWAVVDVSMDGIRGIEPDGSRIGYLSCRLLPSGCLLQDTSNGLCKVTWIVHAEYDETSVPPIFRQLFQSGKALGASRWLASLQRQCEYMAILHSSHSSGAAMSALGRKSVLELSQRMMASFYTAVSKPVALDPSNNVNEWCGICNIGTNMFKAIVRMVIWNYSTMGQPPTLVLSATTTVWLPGTPPQRIHEYLCNGQRRGEWDKFAYDGAVQELSSIVTCWQLRGNVVSVLHPNDVLHQMNNNMLILQEATSDLSCSLVVYSFIEKNMMRAVMDGGDNTTAFLLPSGFAILPDGHVNYAAAASSSNVPTSQNGPAGSLLTAAYQALLSSSAADHAAWTMDDAGDRVCRVISKILAAVGADTAIPA
ncbi:hypothetical protein C2845_PM15G05050 [Panicum miliaceum]|uniref:Uncharacterized protein n=1 Tax=Panicum miliaceum TaxID=4540 RepID=A0A3L6Q7T6_PANMI|nr:hypothetical protein C2845_PM15G05050 [Panicum miliaceum]